MGQRGGEGEREMGEERTEQRRGRGRSKAKK